MTFPATGHGNHLLPTGGGSEVATPAFVSQSGFPTSPNVPDCRVSSGSNRAGPLVSPKVATGGRGQLPSFSAGPCYLITRTDMGEYRVPLQFIPVRKL